jgi:hypothetical protein
MAFPMSDFSIYIKHNNQQQALRLRLKRLPDGDRSFCPSMQRHYRRLIYCYIILLHVSVIRPSSGREYINS